jgi:putative spermidine/putrescine transport system permease protein
MTQPGAPGWLTLLKLAPVALCLGGLFGVATVMAFAQSLGYAPWFNINTFPDFSHFGALWGGQAFWLSLGLTLYYAFAATAIALVLAIVLALALIRSFPGKALYKYVYKLPIMIPYTVGIALAVVMMGKGGLMSRLAAFAGLIDDPSQFPSLLNSHAGWGIIAVYVWKQAPFMTLTIYAVLLGIGRETEEAAYILGGSKWQTFRQVTLPQILPGIVTATLICFAFNIGHFEAPLVLGGGFPDTLPVIAWQYFNDADYTKQLQGMATVVTIFLVAGAIVFAYLLAYRRYERARGRV